MALRDLVWGLKVDDNASAGIANVDKKVAGLSKSMTSMGKKMTAGITAPLAGFAAASIKTVAEFDDTMSSVKAISGATGKEFDDLRDKAKELGRTTAFSASQAAEGMSILAAAGLETGAILETSGDMLTLASAGGLELEQAAGVLTTSMAQFGLEAKDATMLSDVFAKAASSANTNVLELSEAMSYAGGDAANMGMDIQQTNAMLATFADAGLTSGRAGTTFSAMFKDITKNVEKGKIAIGDASVSVYDAAGNMRDMGSIMGDVEKSLVGLTDEQRNAALAGVFQGQSMRGVNAFLAKGSEGYKELEKSIYDSNGAGLQMAEDMEDNLAGAFRGMWSQMEGFRIEVGDILKDDVKKLAGFLGNLADKFAGLDDSTKKTIIRLAGVAMAIGPALLVGGKLLSLTQALPGSIGQVKTAIGLLTSPVGLAVGAIAGLIAVGVHLYKNNEEVREKIDTAWAGIKNIVSTGVDFVTGLWDLFGEDIKSIAGNTWDFVTGTVETFIDVLAGIIGMVNSIIEGDWAGAWESAKGIVVGVFDYFLGLPGQMLQIGKDMAGALWKGLKSAGGWVLDKTIGKVPGFKPDGSHAGGLDWVPTDGYIGELHKGEMVLTRKAAQQYRGMGGTKDSPPPGLGPSPGEPPPTPVPVDIPKPQPRPTPGEGGMVFSPKVEINVEVKGNADKDTADDIAAKVRKEVFKVFEELTLQMG